jgi:hypothetical protein
MTLQLFRIALTVVVAALKLMFDEPLTDRRSRVPNPFCNDNLPPVVSCYLLSAKVFLTLIIYVSQLQVAYPEIVVDLFLSDDDATGNDAEALGNTSAEMINPNPIVACALGA